MKTFLLAGLLTVACTGIAFAGDTPKDVQDALHQGNYSLAEQELRQAVSEHPQSAKAHYILAEVLAHEGNIGDAQKESNQARQLDPKISFTDPTRFEKFQSELQQATSPATQRPSTTLRDSLPAIAPAAVAQQAHGSIWPWVLGAVIVVLLISLLRRRQRENVNPFGNGYAPQPPAPQSQPYGSAYPPSYPPAYPPAAGPSAAGSFVSGLAGGALGAAAVEMFEGHERRVEEGNAANSQTSTSTYSSGNDSQGQAYQDLRNNPVDMGNNDSSWDDSGSSSDDDNSWS